LNLCDLRVLRVDTPHRLTAEFAENAEISMDFSALRVLGG